MVENAKKVKKRIKKAANIRQSFIFEALMHSFILILVLSIFFFSVVSTTERNALNNEVSSGVEKVLDNTTIPYDPITGDQLIELYDLFEGKSGADENFNNGLKYVCAAILFGFFLSLVSVWGVVQMVSKRKYIPVFEILFHNLLLFGIIGCIEFVFFEQVASKFIPVLPSYAQNVLREDLSG